MSLRPDDRDSKRRERSRSRSRYDDEGDSHQASRTKSSRSRHEDGDEEPSKTTSRSRYDDDDDENYRKPASKAKSNSRYDDEDNTQTRLSKSNPRSSRHDDEDGEQSRAMKSKSRSSRYDDEDEGTPRSSKTKLRSAAPENGDEEPMRPSAFKSKRKSLRFGDDEDTKVTMPSMPGGFDDEDDDDAHLTYESRAPQGRTPGLSNLLNSSRGPDLEDDGDDRADRRDKRSSRSSRQYTSEVKSPRETKPSFFDQPQVASPDKSRASFFDPDERFQDGRKPSRKSASFHGREASASSIPYPEHEHAYMPSMPGMPDEDMHYGMLLPEGAQRPYDDDEDEDDRHLAYTPKPLTRSRTDDVDDQDRYRPKSPSRSVSFPQPSADTREASSRRESRQDSAMLSVRRPKQGGLSPGGETRNGRLSVSGDRPDMTMHGGKPPASPLLEPYRGTYQTASPMPSPMMLPEKDEVDDLDELEDFSLEERKPFGGAELTRKKSIDPRTGKKRVMLYDSEGDADKLAKALNHHVARPEPLIEVLPELTHDQLLALREQYKKRVKVSGRGVNLSKQIKSTTTGNFGKAVYATSLGRWEAEAHWANFWYQSHSSNRELLIEALMGKPNAEIREITASFKDKRYQDNLSLCMEKELKPDKFRLAVITALEARRQEETDVWPIEYRNQDVEVLHRALSSRSGGESAILDIVVRRSDNHLRELLKTYERMHRENFARAALSKSNNLVGEVIAHILNGVINRPARDSLLLNHAIKDVTSKNKEVDLRYELLISRLIRLHWDRSHMIRVKEEYRSKYGEEIERSIHMATHGEFEAFCIRLCET